MRGDRIHSALLSAQDDPEKTRLKRIFFPITEGTCPLISHFWGEMRSIMSNMDYILEEGTKSIPKLRGLYDLHSLQFKITEITQQINFTTVIFVGFIVFWE